MNKLKIIGIIAAFAGVLTILYFVLKGKKPKDLITGVDNDKIKQAAISMGLSETTATHIANAPDSNSTAIALGVDPVKSAALANGVTSDQLTSNPEIVPALLNSVSNDKTTSVSTTGGVMINYDQTIDPLAGGYYDSTGKFIPPPKPVKKVGAWDGFWSK